MTRGRRQEINNLAGLIRKACKVKLPVDVDHAVRCLGGVVVEKKNLEFEAQIEKKDFGFCITLSEEAYSKRKIFSVAHELGHLFLHMGYLVDESKWNSVGVYSDSVYNRYGHGLEEYEANEFAAAFLMPRDEFVDACRRHRTGGIYKVEDIAREFGVSVEAASTRGKWLGVFSW